MRFGSVAKVFGAGCVVYFVMAACASEKSSTSSSTSSAGGASASSGSASGGTSNGGTSGILNPVPDAKAAETADEPCNKTYQSGASTISYAEHTYPGASAADLATSVSIIFTGGAAPAGYQSSYVVGGFVRDGAVATACGSATSVRFVRR